MAKENNGTGNGLKISAETHNSLWALLYLALSGLSVLALLDAAGKLGHGWASTITALTGVGRWLLPIFFLLLAAIRFKQLERRNIVAGGAAVFILAVLALFDFRLPLYPEPRALVIDRLGGGYLGLIVRFPLEALLGRDAAVFVLIFLAIAGILVAFNITLFTLIKILFSRPASFLKGFAKGVSESSRPVINRAASRSGEVIGSFVRRQAPGEDPDIIEEEEDDQFELPLRETTLPPPSKTVSRYKPVKIDMPLSLLDASTSEPTSGDIRANRMIIEHTLQSFGINVEMGEVSVGPTVTQYTLKPEEGIKLSAITALHNDLALALAAHPIRIEAPIPGKSLVGIEVPNKAVAVVQLREILEAEQFQKRRSSLMLGLGKDVAGQAWVIDLERLPHLMVAGATGSGKSVCLNSIIISLLYQNHPSDLRFILVDPKRVEFTVYQHMPHLLAPVITEVPATVNALKWLLKEMDRRFGLLSTSGDRNIQTYNKHHEEKLPFIILIIDELADLMVAAASEVEGAIIRLAQMARAVGIHLILATQRPSVDVLTGLIKANITARVAFAVASAVDSRTILDTAGADKLVGRGDMLYISGEITKPKRIQCSFVGDEEIRRVIEHLKARVAPDYIPEVTEKPKQSSSLGYGEDYGGDSLYTEAEALVIQTGKASASFLQRKLKVGYARAARLLDLLEANGVIGPGNGAKPREVLLRPSGGAMLEPEMLNREAADSAATDEDEDEE